MNETAPETGHEATLETIPETTPATTPKTGHETTRPPRSRPPFLAPRRVRRWARLVGVLGVLSALLGLCGFWLSRDLQRTVLSSEERALVNPTGDFQVSFVLAGRDYDYLENAGPMVTRGGEQVRSSVPEPQLGLRTDTVIYVNVVGNRVYLVSIPRDVLLDVPSGLRLRRLPVNYLKIDRSFTDGLQQTLDDTVQVSGVINVARILGIVAVAEGVETEEQLVQLRDLGCDLVQGFHLSPPVPGEEIPDLLERSL